VYALARGAAALPAHPELVPVVADLTDLAPVRRALAGAPRLHAAVVYAPFADPAVPALLAGAVDGRLVELFTSRWADPQLGAAELPSVGIPLLLGWATDPSGRTRWHTAAEISAAALDVLASGQPAQLGAVRPWHERPA
jgi:hypothetical protein